MPSSRYDDVRGAVEAGLGFEFWDADDNPPPLIRRIAPEEQAERRLPHPAIEDEDSVLALPHPFSSDHDTYGYRRERDYDDNSTSGESYTFSLYTDDNLGSWLYH